MKTVTMSVEDVLRLTDTIDDLRAQNIALANENSRLERELNHATDSVDAQMNVINQCFMKINQLEGKVLRPLNEADYATVRPKGQTSH